MFSSVPWLQSLLEEKGTELFSRMARRVRTGPSADVAIRGQRLEGKWQKSGSRFGQSE